MPTSPQSMPARTAGSNLSPAPRSQQESSGSNAASTSLLNNGPVAPPIPQPVLEPTAPTEPVQVNVVPAGSTTSYAGIDINAPTFPVPHTQYSERHRKDLNARAASIPFEQLGIKDQNILNGAPAASPITPGTPPESDYTAKAAQFGVKFAYGDKAWYMAMLPAMQSNMRNRLGIENGVDVPGAQPGLAFRCLPSVSKHKIPGFQPVYQHLGIDSVVVTMVGMFSGSDGSEARAVNLDKYLENVGPGSYAQGQTAAYRELQNSLDSYRNFNEFYNISVKEGRELEVEINVARSTRGIEGLKFKDLPNSLIRDGKSGNPKFYGFVKKLEVFYTRHDRTWYTMDIEVTRHCNTDEPINLSSCIKKGFDKLKSAKAKAELAKAKCEGFKISEIQLPQGGKETYWMYDGKVYKETSTGEGFESSIEEAFANGRGDLVLPDEGGALKALQDSMDALKKGGDQAGTYGTKDYSAQTRAVVATNFMTRTKNLGMKLIRNSQGQTVVTLPDDFKIADSAEQAQSQSKSYSGIVIYPGADGDMYTIYKGGVDVSPTKNMLPDRLKVMGQYDLGFNSKYLAIPGDKLDHRLFRDNEAIEGNLSRGKIFRVRGKDNKTHGVYGLSTDIPRPPGDAKDYYFIPEDGSWVKKEEASTKSPEYLRVLQPDVGEDDDPYTEGSNSVPKPLTLDKAKRWLTTGTAPKTEGCETTAATTTPTDKTEEAPAQ